MFSAQKRIAVKAAMAGKAGQARHKILSSYANNSMMGGSTVISNPGIGNQVDTLLKGIINDQDDKVLRNFYRDIYTYDAVSGAAVDLMSTLPFSDWTLMGAEEKELEPFRVATDMLGLKTILPELSIDYLVLGLFVGSIIYKKEQRNFTDLIPHNPDHLEIIKSPLYGSDPLVTLKVPKEYQKFAQSQHPYFQRLQGRLPQSMLDALKSSSVTLDSLTTLYIPRKTFTNSIGTSIYRRILPMYALERILFRGTMTEAGRRQRSTLHITAGNEDWEPTEEELRNLVMLFQQADLDPVGAILATRNDIQTAEIRPAGDFWKYTDIIDVTTNQKLKALGISEGFLSGDVNFSTAEVSLSVFIEHIRAYREMLTRRIFYDKLFPLVAVINGAYQKGQTNHEERDKIEKRAEKSGFREFGGPSYDAGPDEDAIDKKMALDEEISDTTKLLIPQINWHKQLRPQADQEYLNVLQTLTEKGVPITLRMWAAAGGLTLDHIMNELDEDGMNQQTINKIKAAYAPKKPEGEGDGDGDGGEEEGFGEMSSFAQGPIRRVGLLNRDYGEAQEVVGTSKTGKPKMIHNQQRANERVNREISEALKNLSDPGTFNKRNAQVRKVGGKNPYGAC